MGSPSSPIEPLGSPGFPESLISSPSLRQEIDEILGIVPPDRHGALLTYYRQTETERSLALALAYRAPSGHWRFGTRFELDLLNKRIVEGSVGAEFTW